MSSEKENDFVPIVIGKEESEEFGLLNPTSSSWRFVDHWARKELDMLQKYIEKDIDMDKTSNIRGGIKVLRKLLALPKTITEEAAQCTTIKQSNWGE